jgi:hypothetical protein
VEETGRNSVIPSIRPSRMVESQSDNPVVQQERECRGKLGLPCGRDLDACRQGPRNGWAETPSSRFSGSESESGSGSRGGQSLDSDTDSEPDADVLRVGFGGPSRLVRTLAPLRLGAVSGWVRWQVVSGWRAVRAPPPCRARELAGDLK